MKLNSHLLSLGLCAAAMTTSVRGVTVLYSTDFNAPAYSNGALIGQDSWAITGTSVTNPVNVANTATNGTVTLTTTGQDVKYAFLPAVTAASLYMKAEISVASAQATGDYFLHVSDGGTSNFCLFRRICGWNPRLTS